MLHNAADREALAREAVSLMLRVPLAVDLGQASSLGVGVSRQAPLRPGRLCAFCTTTRRLVLLRSNLRRPGKQSFTPPRHPLPLPTNPQVVPQLAYLRAVQALVDLPVRVGALGLVMQTFSIL